MDAVEIIILAAAAVGLVAFVALAVLIIRQGRVLKDLQERVGPPVPPAAAPSLERVRAVSAASAPAVVAEQPQAAAPTTPAPADQPDAPRQTARQAAQAREQAKHEERQRKEREKAAHATAAAGTASAADEDGASVSSGRGLVTGAVIIVVVGLLAAGGWYLFIRDDGAGASTPAAQSSTTPTSTTTTDSGEIPDDVPPLANKAAYTVAVLNASNVTGAAANKVAPQVQADGYTLGVVDNATSQDVTASEVQYVKGRQEVGWNLAKDLGITKAVQVNELAKGRIGTADAVVIVGKDLAR
ncbi:MAG: LytR C-terminal domain-containing protein [Actinomycetota bacterium]|nr:LytR C-terminal domain-containing protein [Actinomycetota bacterium]